MERVQLVLAEPAALLVAQRRGNAVLLEPGSDARQVILIDECQTVGLERATEVDGDDAALLLFLLTRDLVFTFGQTSYFSWIVAVIGYFPEDLSSDFSYPFWY